MGIERHHAGNETGKKLCSGACGIKTSAYLCHPLHKEAFLGKAANTARRKKEKKFCRVLEDVKVLLTFATRSET
ncbi:hypothetical protein, partial [Pontibacter sp. HSC-36F09]|uniref:hypothetical protein n=1 Tax=Pontibacter sp. HSC-36F09 TaxID=2910966 RepID=UPI0020A1C957